MTTSELSTPTRLSDVFDGFPRHLVPPQAFGNLERLARGLDVLGRQEAETGRPLVEAETLRWLLAATLGVPLANRLVDLLAELPDSAFVRNVHPPAQEVPWFELASRVAVFDTDPATTFGEMELAGPRGGDEVVTAVQARFPSMEPELLEADKLPGRIRALLGGEADQFERALRAIDRQLGWWAALAAVLLTPAAMMAAGAEGGEDSPLRDNVWPLWNYFVCAAVGGWTLTVVGSCTLAPLD